MPFIGIPLGPAAMSTWAGSFLASTVYVLGPGPAPFPPATDRTDFPSAVNAQVVPAGGSSRLPPMTADSTAQSPARDGASFLGGSFPAGAETVRARVRQSDGYTGGLRVGRFGPPPIILARAAAVNRSVQRKSP